jgi:hypothetical protein
MLEIFPEINEKIYKLEKLKAHSLTPSLASTEGKPFWEEIEKLNKELVELDGFKKHILQLEILKYF